MVVIKIEMLIQVNYFPSENFSGFEVLGVIRRVE